MEKRVSLTRVKPEYREKYIEAHRNVPPEVLRRYRAAGMKHCSVHLLGDQLVLITEVEDQGAFDRAMKDDPVDRVWQDWVGPMKDDSDWQRMECVFTVDFGHE
jgi:L-rhamnose mutarotase